jgi:Uma2 family endonuclease
MSRSRAMHTGATAVRKLTYRDFVKFPDDGKRHELIDGVHYVTPAPRSPHQNILGNLHFLIRTHLESHPGGRVFLSPLDVVLSLFDIVEPDLLFISERRKAILTDKHIQGAPDLVVEIGSKSTRRRDEGVKLKLYDRFDVLEYWVVDPDAEVVRVYRRLDKHLQRVEELSRIHDEHLTSPLLPGMSLPLSRVFAD